MSAAALACAVATAPDASAQNETSGIALNRFNPAPAGDRFFGVQSPFAAGDPALHGMLLFDYAHNPLVLTRAPDPDADGETLGGIVSHQLFAHLNLSLALFERLNLNIDVPVALLQAGDDEDVAAGGFESPSSAEFGDLRLGLRLRLYGDYHDPFQLGIGGYVWLPSGAGDSFVSDESVRGMPQVIVGGRTSSLVWTFAVGPEFRRTATFSNVTSGSNIQFGGGLGFLLGEKKNFQLGPEFNVGLNLDDLNRRNTNAEALLGARYRISGPFEIGAGIGTGLTSGVGTPDFRGVLMLAVTPEMVKEQPDRDKDGILDRDDACPDQPGPANADPSKNGCPPPPDKDGDGILDPDDACPNEPGAPNADPSKNGCPPPADKDGDGILDADDACPEVPGEKNEDPTKNGCPPDKDGDGVYDKDDACPDVPGKPDPDPSKNGCPGDTDGDTITDDKDACPNEKGKPDPDPTKNGCPTAVRVTDKEIVILQQVQFDTGRATIKPVSNDLLDEVAGVLKEHPEIKKLEVQGHTDSRGSKQLNAKLSQARAESVVKAMVARGLEADRLTAKGYGPDVPIGDNKTEEGRAQNRRVQFVILEKEAKKDAGNPAQPGTPAQPGKPAPSPKP